MIDHADAMEFQTIIVKATTESPPASYRFSVEDYMRMGEIGLFREGQRVELLDGEVIEASPIGPMHAFVVNRLTELLCELSKEQASVSVQNPIHLNDHSMPEPDFAVLKRQPEKYKQAHPQPDDVLLLVEVAHTSLDFDRNEKLPRYAKASIAEVWIIDVETQLIEQYTQPSGDRYLQLTTLRPGQRIEATRLPSVGFEVDAIFA